MVVSFAALHATCLTFAQEASIAPYLTKKAAAEVEADTERLTTIFKDIHAKGGQDDALLSA